MSSNSFDKISERLKDLSRGEKRLIKHIIDAFEDAIKYQELEINEIPDSLHLADEKEKSKALDHRLLIVKSYEAQIDFLKRIIKFKKS